MIGSGVFLLPASLAHLGSITIFSWMITGIGSIFLALVFARLATLFPKTGGPYVYCKEAYGDFIGFQVAYNYWIYMWVGNAAIAVALTGYLTTFFPFLSENNFLAFLVTAAVVWGFTLVNIVGVHFAGVFQVILTVLKLVPLILISVIAIFFIDFHNLSFFNISGTSNFSALSGGAVLTLWAFLGMESASIPADEAKNPRRDIPRATILGTAVTAVIYILSTVAILGVIPATELKESSAPFADLAQRLFGNWGKLLMAIGAVISCAGTLNGWILLQGQIPLAAANDKLFPSSFSYLSPRRTPTVGLVVSSCLITLLLIFNYKKGLVDQFTFIISLAVLAALLAYLYTTIAEFILCLKRPDKIDRKKVGKSLVIAALAFIYSSWAVFSAGQEIFFYGSMLLLSSIPIYGFMQWRRAYAAPLHKHQ
ncbi:MAG: amino acid permease [Simkania negevensis]|nr:amino acid permease [Simkania negevensis]